MTVRPCSLLLLLLPFAVAAQTATGAPPPPAGDANIAAYKATQETPTAEVAQDAKKATATTQAGQATPPTSAPPTSTPPAASTPPATPPPAGDAAIEAYKTGKTGTPTPAAQATPTQDAETAPQPGADAAPAGAHPVERNMLHAQILLERAHFSPGEIDGAGGGNTRRALAAYQRAQGLEETGELDDATWTALSRGGATLVDYTVTAQDVAGPFAEVPEDMMEKSALKTLGYASAAEALGEKFRASPALLQRLNPGKSLETAGTTLVVPNVADVAAPPKAAKVVVDRSDSSVALVDAQGTTYARYPASTGSQHDPLPVGDWKINGVSVDPTFHYNPELFWDADPAHAKAKIPPGPNNPVGVAWIDLSKPHYGIHGTPEPSSIGKTQSHGCIRVTNWSARELAKAVSPGMVAVLQE